VISDKQQALQDQQTTAVVISKWLSADNLKNISLVICNE
jgi:hypothetical protein